MEATVNMDDFVSFSIIQKRPGKEAARLTFRHQDGYMVFPVAEPLAQKTYLDWEREVLTPWLNSIGFTVVSFFDAPEPHRRGVHLVHNEAQRRFVTYYA